MTMISLPTVSEYIAGIQSWASGLFAECLAVIWIPIGIAFATAILWWLVYVIRAAIDKVVTHFTSEQSSEISSSSGLTAIERIRMIRDSR